MSFDKWWGQLTLRNSGLADNDSKITLNVAEFRRFMAKAFAAGYDERKKLTDDLDKLKPQDPLGDLFGGMFGGTRR